MLLFPHPALLFLLLGLLLLETSHARMACSACETRDALWWVLSIYQQLWVTAGKTICSYSKKHMWKGLHKEWHYVPLGVISGLLRAVWMISWASVFLAFKTSMVCFNSVSSESCRKKQCQVTVADWLNRVCFELKSSSQVLTQVCRLC